jgi:hypothetical protein
MFFLEATNQTLYLEDCGCIPLNVARLASLAYNAVRLVVPIILIIVGMITLTSSLMAQKDDGIKKAQEKLVQKVVAAVLVFLVLTLVRFGFNIVSDAVSDEERDNVWKCATFMLTGDGTMNMKTTQTCNVVRKK